MAFIDTANLVTTAITDNASPQPGDTITTAVTVKNKGPATATTPTVSYAPPHSLTKVEYSMDNGYSWQPWQGNTTLGDIPCGETGKVLIRGRVALDAAGTLENMYTADSPEHDPSSKENTWKKSYVLHVKSPGSR